MTDDQRVAALEEIERKINRAGLRFAVGSDETGYSSTWCAFPRRSDYYIGARSVMGIIKISLHASRVCHLALTDKMLQKMREQRLTIPAKGRKFVEWERAESPALGASLALKLIFPLNYLKNTAPLGAPTKPLMHVTPTERLGAVELGFFFSKEPATTLEPKLMAIGSPLLRTDLEHGHSVSIVGRETTFDPGTIPDFGAIQKRLIPLEENVGLAPGGEHKDLTMMMWNEPKNGEALQIMEIGGMTLKRNQ